MRLFNRNKNTGSNWSAWADDQERVARKATQCANEHRRLLDSGQSTDPAADRHMVEQHEGTARVARANANDYRNLANGR